ncbi:phage holin family protein [Leucobacter allii]|uniref:Phage holin family protein n=1 Tax=Leucobacter allii TaxID=2932247 RepID=A0ABY4FLY9_9MICO|nr:phage holin family protein [Leucobacter allii]UOQ57271.1 phage holin family protein [Leucobacter allii]UOR01713.1 phage holin family protein [Leucobacter allii]
MSRKKDQPGTFELLSRLPQQIVTLAKAEYENAKREVVAKAKNAGIGAGAILVALFFLFFMLEALVIAAIAALALVWPWWLAALVVAAALLVLAAAAILAGIALIKRGNPVPEETLDRVGGDVAALGEVRVNAEPPTPRDATHRMPQADGEGNWR